MSHRLPIDTNNDTSKEDDSLTPDHKAPPGNVFSPIPLISPTDTKLEGGADELPCYTQPGSELGGDATPTNLMLSDASQEELALMADAAAPFGTSHDSVSSVYAKFEGGANDLPCNTKVLCGGAAPTNLMGDMSQEELAFSVRRPCYSSSSFQASIWQVEKLSHQCIRHIFRAIKPALDQNSTSIDSH